MKRDTSGRSLQTVAKTFDIIEFTKRSGGVRLSDVVEEFNIAKSTAHGYLSTLEDSGILVKQQSEYVLGLRLLHLGEQARSRNNLYELAKPYVMELAAELGEGVDFMVEEQNRLFTLYNDVESIDDPNFQIGRHFYLHNSAGGKAVLAEQSSKRTREIVKGLELPEVTKDTITDPDQLLVEIDKTRRRGYAITDEELVNGLTSIGVAVNHPDGSVFGAFGVGGPTYRMDEERIRGQISNKLIEAKTALEHDLEKEV